MLKILMEPKEPTGEGGITTVLRNYLKYFPKYGIEVVRDPIKAHLHVIHAGMSTTFYNDLPVCSHIHGLYWSGDYTASDWELGANAQVIQTIRHAKHITVPSSWVAETFKRDMHISPTILPHGIDWKEWQHKQPNEGYILWNKNRVSDVCDPMPVKILAGMASGHHFVTTFAPPGSPDNVSATGVMPHPIMRNAIQRAGVYLSTTKETFGIGVLEAMASGVPVLGFANGGNLDLVRHGETGYLAKPGDYDDLLWGLNYCLRHRKVLGSNAREFAKGYTWDKVMHTLADVYQKTVVRQPATVSVVIPCYNYGHVVGRAVESALQQSYPPKEIIIVDNNSTEPYTQIDGHKLDWIVREQEQKGGYVARNKKTTIKFVKEEQQGVAHARNRGIREANSTYICCLDADDEIAPDFLNVCVGALESDPTLGVAYTKLKWINDKEGTSGVSEWPGEYDYDRFTRRQNQVPTCAVFRKIAFDRTGGYRQRYAPDGAGAEDAEFYLRVGSIGWGGGLASINPYFLYHVGSGNVAGNPNYVEEDWLKWHPWVLDRKYPFASRATPVNGMSHLVRQYDEPKISVVIPVGPGHEQYLVDALDSLEAQTFRQWEVIVVFDTGKREDSYTDLLKAHPFIRTLTLSKKGNGAGFARNRGADMARADLLLFLDADDWLEPFALEQMFASYQENGTIIYSDYIGHSMMEKADAERLYQEGRLLLYRSKSKLAQIANTTAEFDCELALRQPELNEQGQFYIWSLVTALVPKKWHFEVGGFDESMKSWEDWDYSIRLARRGKCFSKIPHMLINYHFNTGGRREVGKATSQKLVAYMRKKYEKEAAMPCSSCGGGTKVVQPETPVLQSARSWNSGFMNEQADMVMVQLNDGNTADHHIAVQGTSYGYRSHGEQYLMLRQHAAIYPDKFVIVHKPLPQVLPVPSFTDEEVAKIEASLPPPTPITFADDGEDLDDTELGLEDIEELKAQEIETLLEMGVSTPKEIINLGKAGLRKVRSITPKRADVILQQAVSLLNQEGHE